MNKENLFLIGKIKVVSNLKKKYKKKKKENLKRESKTLI